MKKKEELYSIKTGVSMVITLVSCLVIFSITIAGMIASFNALMTRHDKRLSSEICNLITEKMNSSIQYLTDSVQNMSSVLSAQNFDSPADAYRELTGIHNENYVSIGFIDAQKQIYATEQELKEFEKWQLLETAVLASPVSISAPYRSGTTGQPVFTMFTKFFYHDNTGGWMFVTYPLKEIQNIASSESLKAETEVWLKNAASSNVIQCAGGNEYSIGSWTNACLLMNSINTSDHNAYHEWHSRMIAGEPSASLGYSIGDTAYTQIYSAIANMPGWFVVVRIPRSALSTTMNQFRNYVLIFIAVLLFLTLLLIIIMHQQNSREKQMIP